MKDFKGTKKPWDYTVRNVEIGDGLSASPVISIHSKGYLQDGDDYTGENHDKTSICGIWGDINEEDMANARLISYAPELLQALQNLLCIVKNSTGVSGYHLNGNIAEWDEFPEVEQAEQVISKALGKQ